MKVEATVERGDELLTTSDVARRADPPVSVDTVRYWERHGQLRALRTPSGQRLFVRRDVESFLARRRGRQ